jgi:enoyl-CoA hydratase/carnithine racemase
VVAKAREIAEQIATRAPIALQMTKQIIDGQSGEGLRLTLEALGSAASSATDDFVEGVAAFRNKRTRSSAAASMIRAARRAARIVGQPSKHRCAPGRSP